MTTPGDLRRRCIVILSAVCIVVCLTGCQVDLTTTITVSDNGSGTIAVTATADAETMRLAPELADSVNVDDLRAAGWVVEVQNPAANGGLSVVAKRDFSNTDEASFFLSQLSGESGPLRGVQLSRTGSTNDATYTFSANAGLPNGLAGFADTEALSTLGANPFETAIALSGVQLPDVLQIHVQLTTPGNIVESTGIPLPRSSDDPSSTSTWLVPVDGSDLLLKAITRDRDFTAVVASFVSRGLLALLIVLAAISVLYLATVLQRRSRSTPAS